ncbi:MAG: 5-amino-6-(D-ribitylamino)uracil--L-tyrosine 4-hydroxyphenyl transferase CofH [Ferrimicrobium sp.]|uniref:5-amino-6-(D-ribitylamino)uracil--L-tyrosine 4-hydroxyphenyl transferase CofH n=1 Tax=Ferrimicrobium sp. TaxID=2926050 RepID=UPI00261F53DC|nr:5-amino-6-(D-ribitylamino)uracil--L-tyrosine 4-hydroxyphenyl transferase CofH [Ferrimicrobium sp.]
MHINLARWSTDRLLAEASKLRDRSFGRLTTYSPKAFFPFTMLCRDSCGYCTFAKAPARLAQAYMTLDEVTNLARSAHARGAIEALFTLGERPEDRYAIAREELDRLGYRSTVDYLRQGAETALKEHLLPHINAGNLAPDELALLRPVAVSMGIMVESINETLPCHRLAPDKEPQRRLQMLKDAGELSIPMTTGLLIGIGDTEGDRIEALRAIAAIAERYDNIQEVIIQNFVPKPATQMALVPPPSRAEYLRSIALARLILPPTVSLQAPPNLSDDVSELLMAGVNDLGGISRVTPDHVNPERPWPNTTELSERLERLGFALTPRLPIYPSYLQTPSRWIDDSLIPAINYHRDQLGFAREHRWFSGEPTQLPDRVFLKPSNSLATPAWLDELRDELDAGHEAPTELLVEAGSAKGFDVMGVVELADDLRRKTVGDVVTYVANRNINYTNVCTFKCRFCAFSKGPLSLNLRGTPYLLSLDEILDKVGDAQEHGATEVCLQGGIHPTFDGEYYLTVAKAIHTQFPAIHLHGFSALEVFTGAKRLHIELDDYLRQLHDAGLKSLPGTAAEILYDPVRAILCPDKLTTDEWLQVHATAHAVGLRSNVTMMFGSVEDIGAVVRHFDVTRQLGQATHGFTEFVPLPFVHMATPIFRSGRARRGPTLRETVLIHALGRIAYHGVIDNIQVSWVKLGVEGAALLLGCGANDLGGTLMEESISHAAGATHGTALTHDDFALVAQHAGRILQQRTTFYEPVSNDPNQRIPVQAMPGLAP